MKNTLSLRFVAFALVSLIAVPALADTAPPLAPAIGTTSAHSEATVGSPEDSIYLNYFATFHGASLTDLGSPNLPNRNGDRNPKSFLFFDSEVTAAYRVTPSIGVGPVIPFLLVPVFGKGIILGDIGVKAFNNKTLTIGNFNLATNLILQVPTSNDSQVRNMNFGVKTTPNFRYTVPASRVSLGAWTEAKAYLGVIKDKTFKLYAAPYVSYQIAPKFALNLEYEMEAHHNVGQPSMQFSSYSTDLMPGVIWNVTPHVLINPFIYLYTGSKVTVDSSAVGAIISATLL